MAENDDRGLRKFPGEVADATLMLDYAVANAIVGANGRKLDDELIAAIKQAQDIVTADEPPAAAERTKFEAAYRDLALFLTPVTAETLKATSEEYSVRSLLFTAWGPRPISIVWSRKLSAWTLLFVAIAIVGNWFDWVWGELPERGQLSADAYPSVRQSIQIILQILIPFTYGAIGGCLYLLKACQAFIHLRQFDPRRIPEYYNRMILGGVAGGMIVVLVHQIAGDDGKTIQLSAAALGFLAGYNNDLLFSAIERISAAILPKVGLTTVQLQRTQRPALIDDAAQKVLLDRLKVATTDEERNLLTQLLQEIQRRI